MSTTEQTIDARSGEAKMQEAIGLLVNCIISVGIATGQNDQFNRDLWRAAELVGVSKLDLLELVNAP